MTILKDIVERETSYEPVQLDECRRSTGFPKAKSVYTRREKTLNKDLSMKLSLGESGPVFDVSLEDLKRLEWTDQYEDRAATEIQQYTDDDIIQLLQSSVPGQRVIALSHMNEMTDERLLSLIDSYSLHLRLSVCCSSSSLQVRIPSWQLLDRVCAASSKATSDLVSIPEFIQTVTCALTVPQLPIACSALNVLSLLIPSIDDSLIDDIVDVLEGPVLQVVLNPATPSMLLSAFLKNANVVSENVLEPVCLAAISSFLYPYIDSTPPANVHAEEACGAALEIWTSGKALPENLRAFAPAISAFFAAGIFSISPKLISLLSIFREIFCSAVDDCLRSIIPRLTDALSKTSMQTALAILDCFPGVEISRFAVLVWRKYGVSDPLAIAICAKGLPDDLVIAEVVPVLRDLEISSQLVPLAARVGAVTGDRDLLVKVLKEAKASSFDLSETWKFLNFPQFSGTPEEVVATQPEIAVCPFFENSIFREIFVDRLTFFRAICGRLVSSGSPLDLEIVTRAFDSLAESDTSCGSEWVILGYRVLEIFSESGNPLAAWATFALVSKLFPNELRATILTDCEMLTNISKVVYHPILFTSTLEFPGFEGPERQQVRSRLKEFLADCNDGAVARVVRIILDN